VCMAEDGSSSRGEQLLRVLTSFAARKRLDETMPPRLSKAAHELLEEILEHHMRTVEEGLVLNYDKDGKALMHRVLKPLREKERKHVPVGTLELELRPAKGSFHRWLAQEPGEERQRGIAGNNRILDGVAGWDLRWLEGTGAICYERAASRVANERPGCGGMPDASFMRGVVSTEILPTATANGGDHYVLVSGRAEPRFMTVEEVSRAFGLPSHSPVMGPLLGRLLDGEKKKDALSELQAVSALGEGVHVGLCARLVERLMERGVIAPGMTYGSAFSGVDLMAAAVEKVMGQAWEHRFASENARKKRAALRSAWACRGLTPEAVYWDATGEEATSAPQVDLWSMTASCKEFSQRKHEPTEEGQWTSLGAVHRSLDYVRVVRPKAVLIENVNAESVMRPLTAMVGRIGGYAWWAGVLSPETHAEDPMKRERFFIVGERLA